MSRLSTFIDRVLRHKNIAPIIAAAFVDDNAVPPPAVGEPTTLRVDPTTGALLVKDTAGSGSPLNVNADTELPAAAALSDAAVNPTAPAVGGFGMVWDVLGSIWRRAAGDTAGRTVVAGNVADGSAAALPVTIGGVDSSGNSRRLGGVIVGSNLHLYVQQGGATPFAVTGSGSAGTPAAGVISVQGLNAGYPVPVRQMLDTTRFADATSGVRFHPDRTSSDAYGRTRAVGMQEILDVKHDYGEQLTFWGSTVSGGATVSWNSTDRTKRLTTAAGACSARVASHASTAASATQSGEIRAVFRTGTVGANNRYEVGIGDGSYGFGMREQNGIFLAIYNPAFGGVALIPKAAWNVDRLDGTGPSGMNITTFSTALHTVGGWGAGSGQHFTVILINGYPVHFLGPTPSSTAPATYNWRLYGEVQGLAGAVVGSLDIRAMSFAENADNETPFEPFIEARTRSGVNTTTYPMIAIRPKASISGLTNVLGILPRLIGATTDGGNVTITAYLVRGPLSTLTGASWVASSSTYEYDISATSFTPNAADAKLVAQFTVSPSISNSYSLADFFSQRGGRLLRSQYGTGAIQEYLVLLATGDSGTGRIVTVVFTGAEQGSV